MTWQLLTAISVLGLSTSILLQRVLIYKDKSDPVAYAVLFQGVVAVLLLIAASIVGFNFNGISDVWLCALASVLLYGVGHILYAKTLQHVEASVFSVLFATHAVWVMVVGVVLLHEQLSFLQILGSILLFGSVGLLIKNVKNIAIDKGTLLGLSTGLVFGGAVSSWSYVGRYADDTLSWAAISFVASSLAALLISPRAVYKMRPFLKPKILFKLGFLGVFYAVGSAAMLFAYKEGEFSVVSPLRQTGIIVTVLLALIFMPVERNRITRKLLASAICFAGVVLLLL